MKQIKNYEIDKGVFFPPAILLCLTIFIGAINPDGFANIAGKSLSFTIDGFGWMYLLFSFIVFGGTISIMFSSFGKVKIGGPDAEPEVSGFAWCAMAICGGIATAMVFWSVAEPLTHYYTPPAFTGALPQTPDSAIRGLQIGSYHWSYLPYSMFTIFGVAAGYAVYNKKLPFRASSTLYPLLGDKIYGVPGKVIDAISILALIGGVITSLGFGTMQFASGLNFLFGLEQNNAVYIGIIVVLTLAYTFSSYRGLQKGMKIISSTNSYIYIALVFFLFIFGPTKFLLNSFVQTIGSFIQNFIPTSFNSDAFNIGDGWSGGWTIFFWAWWMAYAPLIGMFLARIAIGRTIKQFILVNIFVPGTFILIWFTGFGGSAIYYDHFLNAGIMNVINERGLEVSMYALLQNMPLRSITIPIGILALGFSFITLADAMTSTIASMTTKTVKNKVESEAPQTLKLFWGLLIGGVTIVCLLVSGTVGTQALQSISIVYALPIFVFSMAVLVSIIKMSLENEKELNHTEKLPVEEKKVLND